MLITVADCTDADFREVAPRLREADQNEWRVTVGASPTELIADRGYRIPAGVGVITRKAMDQDGSTLCVWGVNPAYPGSTEHGWVWLVATPDAVPVAKAIHKHLKPEIRKLTNLYPALMTISWDGNPLHQRWLKWIGFEAKEPKLSNGRGDLFTPFQYDRRQ